MLADHGQDLRVDFTPIRYAIRWPTRTSPQAAQEQNAMRLFGWQSREMLGRYAASTGTEHALAEQRKLGIGDRL